jgi:hypothetical protein
MGPREPLPPEDAAPAGSWLGKFSVCWIHASWASLLGAVVQGTACITIPGQLL